MNPSRFLALLLGLVPVLDAEPRKEVTILISQEPDSLDPLFGEMVSSWIIRGAVAHELTVRDENWKLIPNLAVEVPSLANGLIKLDEKGKQTTTYHIRPEAKWSDGTPVTARDFTFCWEVAMDPRQPVITRDVEQRLEKIETPDPRTLVLHWKETYAYSDEYRVLKCLPSHLLESKYKENPENFHKSAYNQAPVANGPFMLQSWEPGQRIVLVPNPHFYGPKPKLEKITYWIVPNTTAAIAQLRAGACDVLSTLSISLDQALELEKSGAGQYHIDLLPGLTWEHIDLNLDNPKLADLRVRQAIMYGIDRDIIAKALFQGKQEVADSFLPPKHYGYAKVMADLKQDLTKAEDLLKQAGYSKGSDGYMVDAKGERLTFQIETTAGNKLREQAQQIFQAQLKKIGIELTISNMPAKVFFSERLRHRQFPDMAMFAWTMSPVADGLTLFSDKFIPGSANNWLGQNMPGWRNAEATQILDRIQVTLGEADRVPMLKRVQELVAAELPSIPLFFRASVSANDPKFKGFKPTGNQVPETWNAEEWHWAE